MNHLVLGYGSLINRYSIARTLARIPEPQELLPVVLMGYERVWDYTTRIRMEVPEEDHNAVFLNLRAKPGAEVNGVIFSVDDHEMKLLMARERYYDPVDVTHALDRHFGAPVSTFICTDPAHLAGEMHDACVTEQYMHIVRSGCAALGPEFTAHFERTTRPFPFPVVKGAYRFIA